ncbi:ribonuclease P protein component [Radicibacter daui]|uniref:ribonuclease P protein component n=1 Tax=Radicibacter daui TaxID=3064829 RepID=UPI004046F76A
MLLRLRQRRQFLAVAATRVSCAASGLVLQVRRLSDPAETPAIGYTASKKVGNAVARNRAKRRLRALAGEMMPTALRGHHYVLIARTATVTRPFEALRRDLAYCLRRLSVRAPRIAPPPVVAGDAPEGEA